MPVNHSNWTRKNPYQEPHVNFRAGSIEVSSRKDFTGARPIQLPSECRTGRATFRAFLRPSVISFLHYTEPLAFVFTMAQFLPVKMSKFDNQPWGFRLQGGIDFAAPLTIQKVSFCWKKIKGNMQNVLAYVLFWNNVWFDFRFWKDTVVPYMDMELYLLLVKMLLNALKIMILIFLYY